MKVNNIEVPYEIVGRRPGDIATCFADASKAERELGWNLVAPLVEVAAGREDKENPWYDIIINRFPAVR